MLLTGIEWIQKYGCVESLQLITYPSYMDDHYVNCPIFYQWTKSSEEEDSLLDYLSINDWYYSLSYPNPKICYKDLHMNFLEWSANNALTL